MKPSCSPCTDGNYAVGEVVALESAQGPICRVVVHDWGGVVSVCRKEEFEAAKADMRKPVSVGFRKSDIIKRIP